MTRSQLIFSIVMVLAITAAGGVLHGRLTGRWGTSEAALNAAELLEKFPDQFGAWKVASKSELGKDELEQLCPFGYIERTFVNIDSGQIVSFFVLVGPVGKTAVHNPEICFSSRNFTTVEVKKPITLDIEERVKDRLWAMTFRENSLDGGLLRVYYGWSDGTHWQASSGGRFEFAGLPYLYKIQLAADLPTGTDLENEDACAQFLSDLLPVLQEHMIPAKSRGFASLMGFLPAP